MKRIIILGLTLTTRLNASFIYQLNNSIKALCQEHGYSFIDNSNVSSGNLWQDGFHLNNSDKGVLLNNYTKWHLFFRSIFYTVDSNSLFQAKCYKTKENVGLIKKNDKALNNQVQVPKTGSVDSNYNAKIRLRKIKIEFPDKWIIAHLNTNSIRNKFDSLSIMVENNADICGAFRDLVLCAQFKKREKHPWRSVAFSKVAGCLQLY